MKIRDLMTKTAVSCGPETNLAAAGALMWDNNCGVLPVVTDGRKLTGILTDRDMCIALATRNQQSSQLTAAEVAAKRTVVCNPEDDIDAALEIMRTESIRRLPVVDDEGLLEGIISVDDIVLQAKKADGKETPEISYADVVETLQAIYQHNRTAGQRQAA
jgi:CBS domain-containing protein